MRNINKVYKYLSLFLLGGFAYYFLEILYRGYSHISMIICGGICFILTGLINQAFGFNVAIVSQMVIGSCIITAMEFITGVVVNIWLKLDVWDYSEVPYNLLGQICLPYSIIWLGLSLVCILVDDLIRYKIFDEDKASYKII